MPDDKRSSQLSSQPPSRGGLEVPQNGSGDDAAEKAEGNERPISRGEQPKKERRHQIPGLRQTPYLKIYLLRCEDLDSYKTTSRKPLREWVKENTPQSQKASKANNQENHDAFEWLILHVVSPEDKVAQNANDRKSSSKRDPAQLIEKIRADINGSSKTAVDRVAQVQINEGQTGTTPLGQNPKDGDTGWGDLIFKLKSLILASFDLRVHQYEEDLKEKESQRSLPGWNFNTFFVLKEGLAMGFESVGLVEDALTCYHELSVGLHSIIQGSQTDERSPPTANTLRSYTNELLEELGDALYEPYNAANGTEGESLQAGENGGPTNSRADLGGGILDTGRKPYRELILANQISAFDFRCYVFARQITLLLRLANAPSPEPQSNRHPISEDVLDKYDTQSKFGGPFPRPNSEPENLLLMAEICQRTVEFIVHTSNTIRNDLSHAARRLQKQGANSENPKASRETIIDNLLASWTYSVADCVLQRTLTQALSTQLQPLLRQSNTPSGDGIHSLQQDPNKSSSHSQQFPARTSSLSPAASGIVRPPSPEKYPSVTSLDAMRLLPPAPVRTGSQDLAALRADLMYLKRSIISGIGLRCGGWQTGLPEIRRTHFAHCEGMQDVSLNDDTPKLNGNSGGSPNAVQLSSKQGIRNVALHRALVAKQTFYDAYESLTILTLALYVLGERKRYAEALITDIAATRFQSEDYSAAASYFRQLAPFYAKGDWTDLELVMLHLYALCLRKLERNEEYVGITLKILTKQVQRRKEELGEPQRKLVAAPNASPIAGAKHLENAIAASKTLQKGVTVSMGDFFGELIIDTQIRHKGDRDGFLLHLRLHHLMTEDFEVQEVNIHLLSVDNDQRSELWVSKSDPQLWRCGWVTVVAESSVMQPGIYTVDKVIIKSENIIFQHEALVREKSLFTVSPNDSSATDSKDGREEPPLHVYPQPTSFEARAEHCKEIHLEKTRSIEVVLSSGWNKIFRGTLSIRAGTAGLRLHTADTEVLNARPEIIDKSKPGLIQFSELASEAEARMKIPYTLESELKEIVVRLEITYTIEHGEFTFACAPRISILLPLGVNVQDIFTKEALFSKFSIFTANAVPLRLLHCHLMGTDDFEVHTPALDSDLDIFSRQPVSLLAKITHKTRRSSDRPVQRKFLLQITYTCLDEAVSSSVSEAFSAFLSKTQFFYLSRLLRPIYSTLSLQHLETAALLRSIDLLPFSSYPLSSFLPAIAPADHQSLLQQLRIFHDTHSSILLSSSASTSHTLTIPVEIPTLSILHTVSLSLPSTEPIVINTAVPAELCISHTRRWGPHLTSEAKDSSEFVYEVSAPGDSWLIGGQRRVHFSANEDEVATFHLLLLPQRTGHLLYPSVDIQHAPRAPKGEDDEEEEESRRRDAMEEMLSSETDYKSQGKSISVVDGLQRTTVMIDHEAPGNGAWVLEAEKWGGI